MYVLQFIFNGSLIFKRNEQKSIELIKRWKKTVSIFKRQHTTLKFHCIYPLFVCLFWCLCPADFHCILFLFLYFSKYQVNKKQQKKNCKHFINAIWLRVIQCLTDGVSCMFVWYMCVYRGYTYTCTYIMRNLMFQLPLDIIRCLFCMF